MKKISNITHHPFVIIRTFKVKIVKLKDAQKKKMLFIQ